MDDLFADENKIREFEKIQKNLHSLEPNTDDEAIQKLIEQIPQYLLEQKDDLMIICELFAIYARNKYKTKKRNIFKLFEKIMIPIKTYLYDQSYFFWTIFGGLFYFKLWFYQKNLISIETIILAAKKDKNESIAEYFFPEIIEKEPEIFEKEIKYKIKCPYTPEYMQEFKELRKKYLKWICESGDYNDPIYKEIETDPLKYSIVTDDVDSFQKIISNSNIDINSRIKESLIQNTHRIYYDQTIFEFALEYNAIKISKFLIMNNVNFTQGLYFSAITSLNYEMIHLVESKIPEKFPEIMIYNSISNWNDDIIEYILNNYDTYEFLEKDDFCIEKNELAIEILNAAFIYVNFKFLRTKLIPFFRNNPQFLKESIHRIISRAFSEQSCFFAREFMKHPDFDINYYSEKSKYSILGDAVNDNNTQAVEILLKDPKLKINNIAYKQFSPLMIACGCLCDTKMVKLLCSHPDIDINLEDERYHVTSFELSVSKGNIYSLNYLIKNVPVLNVKSFGCLFHFSLKSRNLETLSVLLNYYINKNKNTKYDEIEKLVKCFSFDAGYHEEYLTDFRNAYDELTKNNNIE